MSDRLVGLGLLAAGAVAIAVDRDSFVGDLLALAALTWFAGGFVGAASASVSTTAGRFLFIHRALLAHAVLSFPTGRIRGRPAVTAVIALYGACLVPGLMMSPLGAGAWAIGVAIMAVGQPRANRRTSVTERRWAGALGLTLSIGLVATAIRLGRLDRLTVRSGQDVEAIYRMTVVVTALMLVVAMVGLERRRRRLTDAVTGLVHGPRMEVRAGLARALGDRCLEVVFRDADGRWVDELGEQVDVPRATAGRTVSLVEVEQRDVAAVVHSASLNDDSELRQAIATTAGMAAANVRLRAEVVAETEAVDASRARLLRTADLVRHELASVLATGPGRRLERVEALLGDAVAVTSGDERAQLSRVRADVARSRSDIESLVLGLGPLAATRGRLSGALQRLAGSGPVDVTIIASDDIGGTVASTLWFVAAEGIANVQKHSGAHAATVRLGRSDDEVVLEVTDDGDGDVRRDTAGTGLVGLRDRVETLGGRLVFEPTSSGHRLVASIPITGER